MTTSHVGINIDPISLIFNYCILVSTRKVTERKRSGLQHRLLWCAGFQHEYDIEPAESSALIVSFEVRPFVAQQKKPNPRRKFNIIRRASWDLSLCHLGQNHPSVQLSPQSQIISGTLTIHSKIDSCNVPFPRRIPYAIFHDYVQYRNVSPLLRIAILSSPVEGINSGI